MPQYSIRGHEVHFPHQPYGVQLSFMEKMLRTLDEQGNALLEAPTGCGKTLSLLCAALAWQAKRKRELQERAAARLRRQVEGGGSGDGPGPSTHSAAPEAAAGGSGGSRGRERRSHRDKAGGKAPGKGAHGNADDSMSEDDDDATDFEPNAAGAEGADIKKGSRKPGGSDLKHQDAAAGAQEEQGAGAGAAEEDEEGEPPKLPRIFFATRTHSQIAQVVRELKRTAYKPSMAILVGGGSGGRQRGWSLRRTVYRELGWLPANMYVTRDACNTGCQAALLHQQGSAAHRPRGRGVRTPGARGGVPLQVPEQGGRQAAHAGGGGGAGGAAWGHRWAASHGWHTFPVELLAGR